MYIVINDIIEINIDFGLGNFVINIVGGRVDYYCFLCTPSRFMMS